MREAIILASGMGSRLGSIARGMKFRVPVNGVPLICYPARALLQAGVERLVVVVRAGAEEAVRSALSPLGRIDLDVVSNAHPERENGYSFLLAARHVEVDRVFVAMSDHIFHPQIPVRLLEGEGDLLVAGDSDPRYVDIDEATKILADGRGNVLRIGKKLGRYTHIDAGVFLVGRKVFSVAEAMERETWVLSFSDIVNRAVAENHRVRVVDITGLPWTEIDTAEDYFDAEHGERRRVVSAVWGGL